MRVEGKRFGGGFGLKMGAPHPWPHFRGESGGRSVAMVFAEGLGGGWVDDSIDADDITNRFDSGAIGRALGQDDMGHADARKVGVSQRKKCPAGIGVENADVSAYATVLIAGLMMLPTRSRVLRSRGLRRSGAWSRKTGFWS